MRHYWKIFWVCFLVGYFFTSLLNAQHPSVTIVGIDHGNGTGGRGSGVIVANNDDGVVVLTAAHVVAGGGRAWCNPPGTGKRFWATEGPYRDGRYDIAWFRVPRKGLENRTPMKVWNGTLPAGTTVYSEGFGTTSDWPTAAVGKPIWTHNGISFGRLKGNVERVNFVDQGEKRFSIPSIPGDSGSAIYTVYEGEPYLVGITSSSNWADERGRRQRPTHTTGCHSGPIRRFLRHVIFGRHHPQPYQGPQARPQQQSVPQQQCPPGQICPPQQYQQQQPQQQEPIPYAPPEQQSIDTDKLKQELLAQMSQDDRFRGPRGKRGPQGPAGQEGERGPRGPAGPPGKTPEIDATQLSQQIISALPPLRVQIVDATSGEIIDEQTQPLGGTFRFELRESKHLGVGNGQ